MITLVLPPELRACVEWLRAINQQSWQAPPPPALPVRPADAQLGGFYDYMAPIFTETVRVWTELASFRGVAAAPQPTYTDYLNSISAP